MAAMVASFAQKLWQRQPPAAAEPAARVVVKLGAAEMGPSYSTAALEADVLCSLGTGGYGHVFKVRLHNRSSSSCYRLLQQRQDNRGEAVALKIFKNEMQQSCEAAIMKEMAVSLALSRMASPATPIVRALHAHTMKLAHMYELVEQYLPAAGAEVAQVQEEEEDKGAAEVLVLHCMSMELCEGGSLSGVLQEMMESREGELMTEEEAASFLYPVATAIEFCHKNRVLHLDVKPENVLLRKKGRLETACLTDFSLAMDIPSDKPTTAISSIGDAIRWAPAVGIDPFMAPEVAQSGYYSPLADVFSLGCVLLLALTGFTLPWSRFRSWPEKDGGDVDYLLSYESLAWAGLSADVKSLICGMLCPDPLRRLTLHQVLRHPWLLERNCGGGYGIASLCYEAWCSLKEGIALVAGSTQLAGDDDDVCSS